MFKVFQAQKETPTSGDFVQLVEKDMKDLEITYEEITQCSRVDLKKKTNSSCNQCKFSRLKKKTLETQES